MPFSRYQIRNEFSLADPELYKAADKDDPEALLEGVAMAGLVGVLRQLGDLAEFAAEIFHGLHEEVMVTAARGHDLLVRVQQVESDFPAIERAFLSQTGHSAFFSSSGISWHPYMQTEQNLITKGDLPRFVMDSYEECRGPPRLFLLDKFDVGGAGACLKRYTDPSFYKVEASSYEMMSVEAQRDKKIRKTKKKRPRWKNGETPEALQPSHVKLHQLLLEERVQNGASEPARHVKLKKREIKFPFDTESGKGYMEKLLNSPPEDKLVHEVPISSSRLRLPTSSSEEPEPETLEVRMVNSSSDLPETLEVRMVNSSLDAIEEKHISVDGEQRENGVQDDYQSDDVASETEDYMDALATMESEVETDAEIKAANSDPIIKQETLSDSNVEKLQSRFSDSQSASDDESSSIRNKITTFSYSDTTTTSPDNMSPRGVNSSQPFATTEIPYRPRVTQNQVSDNCIEAGDNVMDQEAIFKEQTSKDSDPSEMSSNNGVNIGGGPTRTEDTETAPEEIIASTCVGVPQHDVDNEDNISNSSLVISNEETQPFGPSVVKHDNSDEDGFLENKSDSAEVSVSYSSENETKFKDEETVPVNSEIKDANAVVCDPDDDKIGDDNLPTLEPESVSSDTKDLIPDSNENTSLSACEDTESEGREVEYVKSENNKDNCVSTTEESCDNGLNVNESVIVLKSNKTAENDSSEQLVITPENETIGSGEKKALSEESVISPENKTIESGEKKALSEEPVISPENETIESGEKKALSEESVISPENETIESGEKKELSEEVISPSTDSVPSAYYDHLNIQDHEGIPTSCPATCNNVNENDVDDPSASCKTMQDETLFVIEKFDRNGLQEDQNAQVLDSAPDSPASADAQESKSSNLIDQDEESKSQNQDDQSEKLEATSSIMSHPLLMEEKADILETVDSQNQDYQNDKLDAESSISNHSVSIDEKADQLETLDSQNQDYRNDKLDDESSISNHSVSIEEKADQLETLDSQNQDYQDDKLDAASSILNHFDSIEEKAYQLETLNSQNQDDQTDKLEVASSILIHSVSLDEKADQLETLDSQNHVDRETHVDTHSESYLVNHVDHSEFQDRGEPSTADLSQLSSPISLPGFSMLPELAPINLEEMPPLPPLPPMQWRMGKIQNSSLMSRPDGGQHDIHHFPSVFPQTESHPSLDQNENITNGKPEHADQGNAGEIAEEIIRKPPLDSVESQKVTISVTEIIRPSSISTLPPADDERPNGIRPMKIQRPRTPLIDAVAAHDINKLRKVSERAMPLFPKEEERDTFLEQIRAQSFNLKPAVPTRPIIQGPSTNLRVAAILEKANAIRQAFAGSDDDEDDNDSWSE